MRPPYFWSAGLDPESRESAPMTRFLLTPFAALYAWSGARRIRKTEPVKVGVPVLCVGNLTTGGSGKTPIVQTLRRILTDQKLAPASLSRGYGGRMKGPLLVDPGRHAAADVGDEPLMLAGSGKSWISRDRIAGAKAMIASGVTAIIMDDGHQNPALEKSVSLLVIDSDAPFGNGHVIPKGPLREPIRRGLGRADVVILTGAGDTPQIVAASGLPIFRARLERLSPLPKGPLIAFAGIGRPERFFSALGRSGGDIRDTISFGDHHVYTARQIRLLREVADKHEAKLVTTEKDYVRLTPDQRSDIISIKVRAAIDKEDAFISFILSAIGKQGL